MSADVTASPELLAVIPVRDAVLPIGGDETAAECEGHALLVGTGTETAALALAGAATTVHAVELTGYAPGRAAAAVVAAVRDHARGASLVMPASPDGRDLAPRVAHLLDRPLLAGANAVHAGGAQLARHGAAVMVDVVADGAFVATFQPGSRGVPHHHGDHPAAPTVSVVRAGTSDGDAPTTSEPRIVEIEPPDPATIDLAEAPRIVGGGAGLGSAEVMHRLADVAEALGCSLGATRVVTDWGWAPFERQIGTTGVAVRPELYLAFGISGAVQHTAGLGDPEHVIAVNLDGSCPMMSLADLAVVTDAPALVGALARKLGAES